jgi:hypothetical protein
MKVYFEEGELYPEFIRCAEEWADLYVELTQEELDRLEKAYAEYHAVRNMIFEKKVEL